VGTESRILKKIEVVYKFKTSNPDGKSFKFDESSKVLKVYSEFLDPDTILPMICHMSHCKKNLPEVSDKISWKAQMNLLETRSVDDIRNFWNMTLYPLLSQELKWNLKADIKLMEQVLEQETKKEELIDWEEIDMEGREVDDLRSRWKILLKS
jgi:hypothetical protein